MSEEKKGEIVTQYAEFWEKAQELAKEEIGKYPLKKKETERDRATIHLIGMLEMYGKEFDAELLGL